MVPIFSCTATLRDLTGQSAQHHSAVGGEQAEIGRHLEKIAVFYEFMLVNPQLMLHWQILFYTKLKIIKLSIKKGITILFLIDAVWRKSAFPSGSCLYYA